ncbi:hypothetical protein EV426DRAFT_445895 [Tirmania nivea]|nr:hypothetical protein EV426DRAFT_445895 [Tirmania nivea]
MSLQETGPETDLDDASFEAILSYDWDNDHEFQAGLAPILANATTPEHAEELKLQAKCYYFSRQSGIPISFELFKHYVTGKGPDAPVEARPGPPASKSSFRPFMLHSPDPSNPKTLQITSQDPPPTPSAFYPGSPPPTPMTPSVLTPAGPDKAPYPTSFAHIVELITTGQPIPGIREIPNKISEEKPSESVQNKRKKPWEASGIESKLG